MLPTDMDERECVTCVWFIGMGSSAFIVCLCTFSVRTIIVVHFTQTLVVVASSSATFGLLSAFSPSYGWMVFLRTMLGIAAAGDNQGWAWPQG